MGNSEVGHLNIGAGRVVYMDVTRIDLMIANGDFFRDPSAAGRDASRAHAHRLHLMGLLSDGGVHSHDHAPLRAARNGQAARACEQVFIHCFMDGRDTGPETGAGYIEALQREIRRIGVGTNRLGLRPLLRHGSRQALGAHRARVRRDGGGQRRESHRSRWPR